MANFIITNSIKINCHFCQKELIREYIIKRDDLKYRVCSECKYLHSIIYNQKLSKRLPVLRRIFKFMEGEKNCIKCIYFNTAQRDFCRQSNFTGVGDPENNYPRTFAPDCSHYEEA